ncbi:hypothetical protein BDY21DRAFT_293252 [Lineolata rhizophorae]|uniref:NDT80 domain-containing protein n=1 Tax=Lineolata rhizophorae TaxID=578093 RepID=A0A6A6NPP1_9PEZI|nr:hypothetical protein BDY21DRAFT_293252 [Lineolata rhizophorae]
MNVVPQLLPPGPLDGLDHGSNFDAETYAGSEDAQYGPPQGGFQSHNPQLKRYPSAYDDPFSETLSGYEQQLRADANGAAADAVERGDKLLGFSPPNIPYTLLDYAHMRTTISISAQLHGMFFLAESPWATAGDAGGQPTELTCYRRNLFQITGNITLPRHLSFIATDHNEHIPIAVSELTISATESVEGNLVKIISVPWKTPAGATNAAAQQQQQTEEKTEKEPQSITLDPSSAQDVNDNLVSIPIVWKRLQFRIATANNGRRKELQQHFVVRLKVVATVLTTGQKMPICEVQSGPIIVRGRSPRNFQSRNDFPISGSAASASRAKLPAQPSRSSTGESHPRSGHHAHQKSTQPAPSPLDMPSTTFSFSYDPATAAPDLNVSPDFFDWKMMPTPTPGPATALPPDTPASYQLGPNPGYAQSSPDLTRTSMPPGGGAQLATPVNAPISLSLTDDEPTGKTPSGGGGAAASSTSPSGRPPSFSLNLITSPGDESADLLYEYFPLGLDDWMPPVDAVYRPHVVHHMNLPSDPKALAVKGRSKRYFAEDGP